MSSKIFRGVIPKQQRKKPYHPPPQHLVCARRSTHNILYILHFVLFCALSHYILCLHYMLCAKELCILYVVLCSAVAQKLQKAQHLVRTVYYIHNILYPTISCILFNTIHTIYCAFCAPHAFRPTCCVYMHILTLYLVPYYILCVLLYVHTIYCLLRFAFPATLCTNMPYYVI